MSVFLYFSFLVSVSDVRTFARALKKKKKKIDINFDRLYTSQNKHEKNPHRFFEQASLCIFRIV